MITTIDSDKPKSVKIMTVEIDGILYQISEESGMLKVRGLENACYIKHSIEPNTWLFISDREEW